MPTYTYECQKCGTSQDEFHGMNAAPMVKCTSCGSKRMRKMLGTGAGIIFKGSGFYETDYRRNGGKGGELKPDTKSGSEGKSEGKSESKPSESGSSTKSSDPGKSSDSGKSKKAAASS